jgi:membrane protein
MNPFRIVGRAAPFQILKSAALAWFNDRAPSMGAAIAYYTIFSLAPMLWLISAIVGLAFGESAARSAIAQELQYAIGADAAKALEAMVQSTSALGASPVGTAISLVTLVVAATGVLRELQTSFNVIWKVSEPGVSVLTHAKQFLLCLAVIVALGLLLVVSLALGAAIAAANAQFSGNDVATAVRVLSTGVSFAGMTVVLAVTFKLFPSANPRWSEVWIGAATTAALLELGKYAIGLYVISINGRSFYRAAGAILIVLIWAYYSSQILLFGAELTKAIADRRRRRRSTRARPRAEARGR